MPQTLLDPAAGHIILINTFTVAPDKADALLSILSQATARGMSAQPGFISANLHISIDRTHVANYAQWRSQADIDAMMAKPDLRAHMGEAAAVATSFEPIYYALRESHGPSPA